MLPAELFLKLPWKTVVTSYCEHILVVTFLFVGSPVTSRWPHSGSSWAAVPHQHSNTGLDLCFRFHWLPPRSCRVCTYLRSTQPWAVVCCCLFLAGLDNCCSPFPRHYWWSSSFYRYAIPRSSCVGLRWRRSVCGCSFGTLSLYCCLSVALVDYG